MLLLYRSFLRALQLTRKEVYTFDWKFIVRVQGKQVQKISVICIQDEDNAARGECFPGRVIVSKCDVAPIQSNF